MLAKPHEDDEKPALSRIQNRRFVTEAVKSVLANREYITTRARNKHPALTIDIKDDPILHAALMERMTDLINGATLIIERCRQSHHTGKSFEWTAKYLENLFTEAMAGTKDEDCAPA